MKLLKTKEVEALTSLTRQRLWELRRAGKFPKPVRLTPRRVGYVEDEVLAWLAARVAERDGRAAR